MTAFQVRTGAIYRLNLPVRDSAYRKWIRGFPCVVCIKSWWIEAAHTGPHGMAQKASDRSCLPLCLDHHRKAPDSLHRLGPVRFQERHHVDIEALVAWFNGMWEKKQEKAA